MIKKKKRVLYLLSVFFYGFPKLVTWNNFYTTHGDPKLFKSEYFTVQKMHILRRKMQTYYHQVSIVEISMGLQFFF